MSTLRKIWEILAPTEQKNALLLLGLMVVGMALEMLGVGLVIPVITVLTQENFSARYPAILPFLSALGNPDQQTLVVGGMLTLVVVYLVKAGFLAVLAWLQTRFAFGVQRQLSQQLFATYLRQPYTFHLQRNSAQLIRNAIDEVGIFVGNTLLPGMLIITESMVLLGVAGLLLIVEPLGTMIVALVLGGAAWGFHHVTHFRLVRWGRARLKHDGMRVQHLQQGLGGAKDVKLLGRESEFLAQYDVHNVQSARMGQFQAALQQLPRLWLELLAVVGVTLLVLTMLARGRDMTSIVPTMGLFAIAAFRLMPSVNRILNSVLALRYGLAVVDTLHSELRLAVPDVVVRNVEHGGFKQEIHLADIKYAYPGSEALALDGLSITVRKGEFVGLIGTSGAGKSTLVDVILGLLTPDAGKVAVDGRDIQQNLRHWQDQLGYVPQAIYLTDDTLRRNVAFGLRDDQIDDAAVRRAIRVAQMEEFVGSLPEGIETIVGERGVRLSGGQRQRIGIARALYHDPPILVLDEATSALDTDTEHGVMQAIMALHGTKTIIIVAHRLSTVEQCDRLYRLEGGKIVEEVAGNAGKRHSGHDRSLGRITTA